MSHPLRHHGRILRERVLRLQPQANPVLVPPYLRHTWHLAARKKIVNKIISHVLVPRQLIQL